ncbi:CobW family GTP-binding protein [Humitalea sp. 24SJ18S-53]|uniref:CobW family GTP-binding protein n=1 Tax=Humitalea sp. 24SJ18S-53 TaxID=3422307 RepID=UPI003D66B2CC
MTIPVTLVTGFLGSGKTTLVAHLLAQPGMAGTLVVVNEFGEVGIDHDLLEASSDDTILLANGCLCCTIRGNLVDTLLDVAAQREAGRLRAFDRVVVETSGVADPAPLIGFLLSQQAVTDRYHLAGVVTTVDAVAGRATLARQPEAASQVAAADLLVLTKSDLVPAADAAALESLLHGLNPGVPLRRVLLGKIDVADLLVLQPGAHAHGPGCDHDHGHDDHTARFRTTIFTATRGITEAEVPQLLASLRAVAGPSLLRLKGFVPLDGSGHLVLQGAMMVVHDAMRRAVPAPGGGRVVAITEGEPPAALATALAGFGLRDVNQVR